MRGSIVKKLILAAVILSIAGTADGQRGGMPRGSFLLSPARSTQALLNEFDTNAEVSRRYVGIFGRTKEETRVILSRLRPKELTDDHRVPVAFYSGAGQWLYRENTLS